MKTVIIKFGLLSIALLLLVELSRYSLVTRHLQNEIMAAGAALLLLSFGAYIGRSLLNRKITPLATNQPSVNHMLVKQLGISEREYEVLNEMASGKSNKEIAHCLFIAESTVKSHVSNLLVKLNARRRTEAISIAREKKLIIQL